MKKIIRQNKSLFLINKKMLLNLIQKITRKHSRFQQRAVGITQRTLFIELVDWLMTKSGFLASLESFMLTRQYSKRTISSYFQWVRAFIVFNNRRFAEHVKALEKRKKLPKWLDFWRRNQLRTSPERQSMSTVACTWASAKLVRKQAFCNITEVCKMARSWPLLNVQ